MSVSELEAENARLKAQLWVAKDSALRTYDGLTTRHDRYREALEKIAADRLGSHTSRTIAEQALKEKE